VNAVVKRGSDLTRLSIPEHLEKTLDVWKVKPLNFWIDCIDTAVGPRSSNHIRHVYLRVTSSAQNANLYRMFAAVAVHQSGRRFAKACRVQRLHKARLGIFFDHLVRKVIEGHAENNNKDHIRSVFEDLYKVGPQWSKWAHLIGGSGGFFAHPDCLTTSTYVLLSCRTSVKDHTD